ncbi:MAG: histidine phosphatase family protein [Candidatus Eisenbacteria bacterium]
MSRRPSAPAPKRRGERRLRAATLAGITAVGIAAAALADAADPPAPRGLRYVTLIRHGHYDRVDSLDDRTANGLSRKGREQAHLLGRRLAALPVTPAQFVSSDLLRAIETADEIGAVIGRTATRDTLIAECTSPSSRPGLNEETDPAELAACQASMEAAWRKYFVPSPASDQHDVLVCHGNVIRWFVNRALGNDTRHWTSLDIGHASLTVISVRPDGGTGLIIYSDVGHLPVGRQSWAGRGAGWGVPKK